jgi:hypothetical protein
VLFFSSGPLATSLLHLFLLLATTFPLYRVFVCLRFFGEDCCLSCFCFFIFYFLFFLLCGYLLLLSVLGFLFLLSVSCVGLFLHLIRLVCFPMLLRVSIDKVISKLESSGERGEGGRYHPDCGLIWFVS